MARNRTNRNQECDPRFLNYHGHAILAIREISDIIDRVHYDESASPYILVMLCVSLAIFLVQAVLERILTPEHVAHICAELQERLGGQRLEDELADLDGRIAGVRRSLARLLDLVEEGGLAVVTASERLALRQAELTELGAQRAEKARRWCRKNLPPDWLLCVRA